MSPAPTTTGDPKAHAAAQSSALGRRLAIVSFVAITATSAWLFWMSFRGRVEASAVGAMSDMSNLLALGDAIQIQRQASSLVHNAVFDAVIVFPPEGERPLATSLSDRLAGEALSSLAEGPLLIERRVYWAIRRHFQSPLARGRATFLALAPFPMHELALFWLLVGAVFCALAVAFKRAYQKIAQASEAAKEQARAQLAAQVAHDILSPLAALEAALSDISGLAQENQRLVRRAATRIRDIATDLLKLERSTRTEPAARTSVLVAGIVDEVLTEKRARFAGKPGLVLRDDSALSGYGVFARLEPSTLKRVLSNLVDNAVQALRDSGTVSVALRTEGRGTILTLSDDGIGIPPHVLSKLGTERVSFGKDGTESGCGLGVYAAAKAIEEWGGSLEFRSEVGRGTEVFITIPTAGVPAWFCEELRLPTGARVIIVDDDPAMHQLWKNRLHAEPYRMACLHFTAPGELEAWWRATPDHGALVLMDYEFGGSPTPGFDTLDTLGIAAQSVLVTSHAEEVSIQQRCVKAGLRLLPKSLAAVVPLRSLPREAPAVVLIDDDELVHRLWESGARKHGKRLVAFTSAEQFWTARHAFPPNVPCFVDRSLGAGIDGREVARKLHDAGFTNVYLTTGYEAESIPPSEFIRAVLPKDFPAAHLE